MHNTFQIPQRFRFIRETKHFWHEHSQVLFLLGSVFLLLLFLLPTPSFDAGFWKYWISNSTRSIGDIYTLGHANYPPILTGMIWLFGRIINTLSLDLNSNIHLLKASSLIFDLGIIFLVYLILRRLGINISRTLLVGLNIALVYITLWFGQFESVFCFFILLSIIAVLEAKWSLGIVALVLGLNTKPQAIVFVPLVILLFILSYNKISRKQLAKAIFGGLITQLILLLPFILDGSLGSLIYEVVLTGAVDKYPEISTGALNAWIFLVGQNNLSISSNAIVVGLGMSYKLIGLILFVAAGTLSLLPILIKFLQKELNSPKTLYELTSLTVGVFSLAFFLFNTQMHERYAYPAVLFLGIYAALTKRLLPYILISVAFLLNLEVVTKFRLLSALYDTFLFNHQFVAYLYCFAFAVGVVELYRYIPNRRLQQHSGLLA